MHNKGKLENNSGLNQITKVSDSEKPNIILVVMDSLRYDHVGTNRGSYTLTPFLDSLKEKAITFTEAIAQGPSTRVSMTALMSSTYSSMYGGSFRLSKTRPLIHEMLKEAGYTTAGVTANLYLSTDFGWERGFDFFDDCRPEGVYQKKYLWRVANQVGKRVGYPLIWPKSLSAEFVFEAAKRFLKGAESPFFLWVHLMDTHWPYAIQKFSWSEEWKRQRQSDEKLRPRLVSDPPPT
jgi:arylsulfatase A-like enzyme